MYIKSFRPGVTPRPDQADINISRFLRGRSAQMFQHKLPPCWPQRPPATPPPHKPPKFGTLNGLHINGSFKWPHVWFLGSQRTGMFIYFSKELPL